MGSSEQERNEALEARVKELADKYGIRVEDIPPALHQAIFGDFTTNELKKPKQGVRKIVAAVKRFKEKVQPVLYVPAPPSSAAAASSAPSSSSSWSASAASASSPGGQQDGAAGGVSASAPPPRLEEHVQQLVVQPGGGVGPSNSVSTITATAEPSEDGQGQQQKAQQDTQEGGEEEEHPSKKSKTPPPPQDPQAVEPFSFLPAFLSEVRAVGPLLGDDAQGHGRGQSRLMQQLFHYFTSEAEELRAWHERQQQRRLRQEGEAANSTPAAAADDEDDEGSKKQPPLPPSRRSVASFLRLLQLQKEVLSKEWICVAILENLSDPRSATEGLVQLRKGAKLQEEIKANHRKARLMLVAEHLVTAGKAPDGKAALALIETQPFSNRMNRYLDYPSHPQHDPKIVADKIVDFLDTKDDLAVRETKIRAALTEFDTEYRSDSSFISTFESGEEDVDAEEVAAIMALTSSMFARNHIFWSHNHLNIEATCRAAYLEEGKTWQQALEYADEEIDNMSDVEISPKRRFRRRYSYDWDWDSCDDDVSDDGYDSDTPYEYY